MQHYFQDRLILKSNPRYFNEKLTLPLSVNSKETDGTVGFQHEFINHSAEEGSFTTTFPISEGKALNLAFFIILF